MKKKVIIFDMDGVLFDTTQAAQKSMQRRFPGLTAQMQQELLCGNFHEEVAKITLPHIEETEEEMAIRREEYAKEKAESPLFPGILEMLKDLHSIGCILVMNTSAFDRTCLPLLERQSITGLFDFLATADVSKSKVEKFGMISEKYDVRKEDMVFVTDTLGDLREASIAGVPTIAVTYGAHDKSYFEREEHVVLKAVVDSVEKLRELLSK